MTTSPAGALELFPIRARYPEFEAGLTKFSKIHLIIALTGLVLGSGLLYGLKYFEETIDGYDNRPDSTTQKIFSHLTTLSDMLIKVGMYVGVQGFLLSQIINIGFYLRTSRSAIVYSEILPLNLID